MAYLLDATSLQIDPNMVDMPFTAHSHAPAHASETGQAIYSFLTSRMGVAVLMGSIIAAPSRPPVIATEPFIAKLVGDAAFTDDMKKYTGRVVRFIVEQIGGEHVRRGVKVTVPSSRYGSGSIYTFHDRLDLQVS
jgi:hypothetical protein